MSFLLFLTGCQEKKGISGQIPTLTLRTFDGQSFVLGPDVKEVTLLVFWATWCQPCLMEIPSLVSLHEKFKGGNFRVVSVNVDDPDGQKVRAINREYGITYPVLSGSEATMKQFGGITALPTSFLIGRDGRIREKLQGLRSEESLERMVEAALAETN